MRKKRKSGRHCTTMNEGIHPEDIGIQNGPNNQFSKKQPSKGQWFSVGVGTAVAVVAAWGLYQSFYAEQASAPTENDAGTARISGLQNGDQSLARVNGIDISYNEIASESFSRVGLEVLDSVINREIIKQEVQKRGITISEAEVRQEVARIAKQVNLPVDAWYQMLRTERNVSPVQYQRDVVWPKLALEKLAGTEVSVTDQEMQRAFIRDYGPRVRCKMIMMDNLRRADDLLQKVRKDSGNFEKYAREFSVEPHSRALGGSFPPIHRYSSNKTLEDAAFALKPGEISGLIPMGTRRYAILKCEGLTQPIVSQIEEVSVDLKESLVKEKIQNRVTQVFNAIKKNARVDNYLTRQSTGTKAASASSSGQIVPTSGTRTK